MAHNQEVGGASPSAATNVATSGLVAGQEERAVSPDIARLLCDLEHATAFLQSRYIEALIEKAIAQAVQRANSPWLDRSAAAAYCHCSVSEIDRAAVANAFPTHHRAGTPLFRRDEIDAAIAERRWPKRSKPQPEQNT